ncbi:MAG TPA: dTDP-4-dehydrorhamnose 3,5-epimerase [Ignavibacteriaceae bacterium]|jgi:dTDP-4-dehydrorhamnose 3,5-epimerase|nr:dTDP-4-dehydrorhamnose 3,5-epimerase [Ignavibacteriaceae bacterium]
MEINGTNIPGVLQIRPDVFEDSRGYFLESFNEFRFSENRIENHFVQDNISRSARGTVRGLHYQVGDKAQGKLCQVIAGSVLDIAVDIRFGSPTFGKHVAFQMSEENHMQLWIPPGFAHGFSVLSDYAIFLYKCTDLYSKQHERAIIYNDPQLNINWGIDNPIVSDKDLKGKPFNEIDRDFIYSEMKI